MQKVSGQDSVYLTEDQMATLNGHIADLRERSQGMISPGGHRRAVRLNALGLRGEAGCVIQHPGPIGELAVRRVRSLYVPRPGIKRLQHRRLGDGSRESSAESGNRGGRSGAWCRRTFGHRGDHLDHRLDHLYDGGLGPEQDQRMGKRKGEKKEEEEEKEKEEEKKKECREFYDN